MKKSLFTIHALLVVFTASAQFQNTDELRQYNNNNIRPNGHQSITAAMLNNLHAGMLDFIDTALLNRAKSMRIANDTIYLQLGGGQEIPIVIPLQINSDWNATSGPAQILNKPSVPTLANILAAGNLAIPGTTEQAPIVMQQGDLLTTPQAGAIEYDGQAFYLTDGQGNRYNLIQGEQMYMMYPLDYSADTMNINLMGLDVQFIDDPTYAPTISATFDFQIDLESGTERGTIISVMLGGLNLYTLTVNADIIGDVLVMGTVKANQDIKYPTRWFARGANETYNDDGTIQSVSVPVQFFLNGFTTPTISFGSTGGAVQIGCTYKVEKKQQGHWIYN